MDRLLLEDVRDRIAEHSGTRSVQIVTPGSVRSAITAEDVMELARDSVTSRVLIMDVRRQTLTRLQQAFSSVVRFNRADLNRYCYAVLIGEGPVNLLKPGRGLRAFPTYLADLRNNFNAAVFFGDPFLTHTHEEIQEIGLRERGTLPDRLPRRFKKFFSDDQVLIGPVDAPWSVAYGDSLQALAPTALYRTITVVGVDRLDEVVPVVAKQRAFLQTAGIAASPEELYRLASLLGAAGVTRISAIGAMSMPEAGWHHDGRFNLIDLVRMTEIEQSAEAAAQPFAPYAD